MRTEIRGYFVEDVFTSNPSLNLKKKSRVGSLSSQIGFLEVALGPLEESDFQRRCRNISGVIRIFSALEKSQ